jgi:hypothetical protein
MHRQFKDGQPRMPAIRPESTQAVTFTTSTQSAAFGAFTAVIRVIATADVFLAFGASPTATAVAVKVPANTVEYFGVYAGEKVACYDGVS